MTKEEIIQGYNVPFSFVTMETEKGQFLRGLNAVFRHVHQLKTWKTLEYIQTKGVFDNSTRTEN